MRLRPTLTAWLLGGLAFVGAMVVRPTPQINPENAAYIEQGQAVLRGQTPLFFHALGGRRFELRSAGPDRELWTSDDLHRNADGSFRRGAALNPPSLVDPK